MKEKLMNRVVVISVGLIWFAFVLLSWMTPASKMSINERRKLTQFPKLTVRSLITADFMEDFEKYAKDQFPNRFLFRKIKAYTRFYLFRQMDNNDIYMKDGYAVKLEYPLNEASVQKAGDKFKYLYEKYMKEHDIKAYLTIIPDKGYFLSEANGYPSMDYNKLFKIMEERTDFAEHISIAEILEIDDYYKTDTHWKQENLEKVADRIGNALGIERNEEAYKIVEVESPFYGVYYGHSALPMKPDKLRHLTNSAIKGSTVYNEETKKTTSVYDLEKIQGNDPYDVYLSGAAALLNIDNPKATTNKELIIFRDSFGSSIAPLLLEGYSKVTLIDIRYIASDLIGDYVTFKDQDVLFIYNTAILNSSSMLK